MIKTTMPDELNQWLQSGEAVLVDVREPNEYEEAHIGGAIPLPLASVRMNALPPHHGKKLVMQCRSGGRSHTACAKLVSEIPDIDVYNLVGGIEAWKQAGYNVAN